jgi:hypothetical protein
MIATGDEAAGHKLLEAAQERELAATGQIQTSVDEGN